MLTTRRMLLVCFIALPAACTERASERADSLATTAATAADSATFPGRAVIELSALREGVTPDQWMRDHPRDSLAPFTIAEFNENSGLWCVRASSRDTVVAGATIRRYAYFYPPPVPAARELPSDSDPADIVAHTCILGEIWVEAPHSDSATGHQAAERTREALMKTYGKITPGPDFFAHLPITDSQKAVLRARPDYENQRLGLLFFGSAYWHVPGRWERGPVTVVSAFDFGSRYVSKPRILAFAYMPNAKLERDRHADKVDSATTEPDTALEAAARLTHFDAGVVKEFLALKNSEVEKSQRIGAIAKWLARATNLEPARRAAALFVADGIVPERLNDEDSVTGWAYAKIGLKFVHSELGGSLNYDHGLLEESLRLDPNGPIGYLATIALLDRGFDLTGMCGGGFDEVIKAGEPFLARLTTPGDKAHVLFLLGDAYADIVGLAAGEGQEYVDTADFAARAPGARRKAIAYYRQGIALNRGSAQAGAAWLEGWRLLAGLPPSRTHFFCLYD